MMYLPGIVKHVESRKSLFMDSDILMLRFYYLLVFRLLVWPDV